MGYKVSHNGFGSGEVVSIQGGYIEVDFSGQKKSFQFPKAFEVFLKTDDSELLGKIEEEKKRLPKKVDPPKETFSSGRSSVSYALKHNHDVQIERNINNPLVGDRAQTISVRSEAEMFEIVGYMAKPGRIGSFEAEIPTDGRDKTFERLFPGQTYRPIEMGDTPSGLPNKMGPQFRINFLDLRNVSTHSCRKMMAMKIYLASGKDLALTCDFLQHSSPAITQRYLNRSSQVMESAIEHSMFIA